MIYIVNETNQQLSIKAEKEEAGLTTLGIKVADGLELDIAATENDNIASAMLERFEKEESIKNNTARFNFKLTDERIFIDRYADGDVEEQHQGVANAPKLITIPVGAELPERYSVAKDMIAIVHHTSDVVEMACNDLNGTPYTVTDEQNEFAVTVLVVKWYNWSKLRNPVNIIINGEEAFTLTAKESNVTKGRMINSVKSLRKQQNNKAKK